jgi:hypothetical protein
MLDRASHKRRIESGQDYHIVKGLCDVLRAYAAGHGNNGIIVVFLYGSGELLHEFGLALPVKHLFIYSDLAPLRLTRNPDEGAKGSTKNNLAFLHPDFTISLTDLQSQKSSK